MLEASGLMVFYENMLALNNVSIRCGESQIVGVFGANSAGKSTLMYTLSGIIEDIRKKEEMAGGERISVMGSIVYQGQDIMKTRPSQRAKKGIVLCPERRRIFKESNVIENLRIGGYLANPSTGSNPAAAHPGAAAWVGPSTPGRWPASAARHRLKIRPRVS